MKKINSIHFGGKFIWLIIVFMVIVPSALYLINIFLKEKIILKIIIISIIAGSLIGLIFLIILAIELMQDKKLNEKYAAMKGIKIFHGDNRFECASCGNMHVAESDKVCKVCGQIFEADSK